MRLLAPPLALALLVALPAGAPRAGVHFMDDLDAAVDRGALEQRPVFVHFTAPWCQACQEMKERVYPLSAVSQRLARFVPVQVDVEAEGGDELWMEYRISSLPTLVFLRPDGEEVTDLRMTGLYEEPDMVAALDRAIAALEPPPAGAGPTPAKGAERAPWWPWVLGAGLVLLGLGLALRAALRRRASRTP